MSTIFKDRHRPINDILSLLNIFPRLYRLVNSERFDYHADAITLDLHRQLCDIPHQIITLPGLYSVKTYTVQDIRKMWVEFLRYYGHQRKKERYQVLEKIMYAHRYSDSTGVFWVSNAEYAAFRSSFWRRCERDHELIPKIVLLKRAILEE